MILTKINIPTDLADKLQQLALQELRPLTFQAEYMLCQAIQRARLKPDSSYEKVFPVPRVDA